MSAYKGFNKVKLTKPQRSSFDLTHDKRLSCQPGTLVPILVTECVPSDKFSGSSEMLLRLAPLLAPIYDQVRVYVHFFYVPNRLLWEDWEEFITGGRLGTGIDPVTAPVVPQLDIGGYLALDPTQFTASLLPDYLGVPILDLAGGIAEWDDLTIDLMPFACYQMIYENYYRDRNFNDDVDYQLASGIITGAPATKYLQIRQRNYSHDYFTSALPFTQRGEEVLIPVDSAVEYFDRSLFVDDGGATDPTGALTATPTGAVDGTSWIEAPGTSYGRIENIESVSNISTTINDFRSAYALQVWLERNAVGGSRYTESTQAHFGVRPQDSRLQRPEYIGGGMIPVKISEVVSTAYSANAEDAVVPLANMAGHGVSYGNTNSFNYFCTEHGFIMGILSVMTPPSYHQGLSRMFRRRSFLDYPWPTFAKLGEQQVDKVELFCTPTTLTEDDDGVLPLFGYQSRYADWKYIPNWNHGAFHDTLLFWTATRDFSSTPALGQDFIQYDPSTFGRMFAVNDGTDMIWVYCHNKMFVKRPLPYFGIPNTLGFV